MFRYSVWRWNSWSFRGHTVQIYKVIYVDRYTVLFTPSHERGKRKKIAELSNYSTAHSTNPSISLTSNLNVPTNQEHKRGRQTFIPILNHSAEMFAEKSTEKYIFSVFLEPSTVFCVIIFRLTFLNWSSSDFFVFYKNRFIIPLTRKTDRSMLLARLVCPKLLQFRLLWLKNNLNFQSILNERIGLWDLEV